MEKRLYNAPDIDALALVNLLGQWYASQGYQAQSFPLPNGGVGLQARKESTWRTLTGMSAALSVSFTHEGEYLAVEVGGAKWVDKGVVGAVSALVFWPTLATAGVGAYQQQQMLKQTWEQIERHIMANSAYAASSPPPPQPMPGAAPAPGTFQPLAGTAASPPSPRPPAMAATPRIIAASPGAAPNASSGCGQCGQPLRPGAKFCDGCGAPVVGNCPSCGQPLRPGARFCDECGAPVA
jgi:hypothetical protein